MRGRQLSQLPGCGGRRAQRSFLHAAHSTWNEGMRLCKSANVKKLAIFHHEPEHTDDIMDIIAEESKAEWDQSFVCREGMEVIIREVM